jgi:dipeptidyl aminopeptidase/acylaminoacyl peptidase
VGTPNAAALSPSLQRLRAWLEHPTSGGPTISADASSMYFVSNRGGIPQAWASSLVGGAPVCIHSARENVGGLMAAPEGSGLILALDHGGNEHWQLFLREGTRSDAAARIRPLTSDPDRIHDLGGWRDGHRFVFSSNRRDPRFFDVYELNTQAPGEPRLLRQDDAWSAIAAVAGDRVLVNRANTNLDSDLILLDGEREVLLTPHSGELSVWSSDLTGNEVVAGANPDREFAGLIRYRDAAAPEPLVEFGADVELVRAERGGTRVAFSVNRGGRSELHVWNTASSTDRTLGLPHAGVVATIAWIPRGDGFVFDFDSPAAGTEIWHADLATGNVRPITPSPLPMPGRTVEPSLHSYRAEDGLEIPYWEYAPPAGPVRGTLVLVHGGPESQARPRFGGGIPAFFVGEGWRVLEPNVRGSTGYGRTYVHLDDVRKRMDSVRDLRDLVRALTADGTATPGQIGVLGGSYGGFMVLAAITNYPDLWGAAVEFFGIANFVTFLEHTGVWRRKVREDEYGSLERDREFLESISPIHAVERIVTPLLVAHGDNDPRVPIVEAEQIVDALRKRGVPVEFLRYGNEGHGFTRIENQVDSFGRSEEFFARHLPPPNSTRAAQSPPSSR